MMKYPVMVAALLAAVGAGPARAQAVVEEPGYCAQYYPSANCQNYGPGNPLYPGGRYVSPGYGAPGYYGAPGAYAAAAPVVVHHRRYHHDR
jgi:hypothetical protein